MKVYQGLLDQGYLSENIYLYGESAGAMLCLSVSHYLRDNGIPMPGKICVYAPAVNIQDNYDSRHLRDHRDPVIISNVNEQLSGYFPERFDRTDPYISAIYGDFDKFPPIRINVGSEEVLFDDSVELYTKCKEAGVNVELKIWENLFHVFTMFPTPESEKALKEDADFFNK